MRDLNLVANYRILDKDLSVFSDKINSSRYFETELFLPNEENKNSCRIELNNLKKRVNDIDKKDSVLELLQSHYTDFVHALEQSFDSMYDRPFKHITIFIDTFSNATRYDSRPDAQRAEIIINRFSQADSLWKSIMAWLGNVSYIYLQELIDQCYLFIKTMVVEVERLEAYFPSLSQGQIAELRASIENLSYKMNNWIKTANEIIEKKGMKKVHDISDDDTIKFEEQYYRAMLENELGVSLDALLSWHDSEIEKTRNEVFEIAKKLKISDPVPKTMTDVNNILFKYAGPCSSSEEMFKRANEYIIRTKKEAKNYVWLPDGENCNIKTVPEYLREANPWGGYGTGCRYRRPILGSMFLNNYNYKTITDGWIKINTVHEAYPGHHAQFVRHTMDPIPETMKIGAKMIPIMEGTALRSERLFEHVFPEDQFYPLFVAYRRHHTSVRIKADLMLRYFGRPIKDAVQLYMDELGFVRNVARGQVKAQEYMQGYFTTYYYGMKKICDWEKEYKYDEKKYTELLISSGKLSLENFKKFLDLNEEDKYSFLHDFLSMIQFR